jgi:hypothetical protein
MVRHGTSLKGKCLIDVANGWPTLTKNGCRALDAMSADLARKILKARLFF